MPKLLFFALIGVAVYLWMRGVRRVRAQNTPPQSHPFQSIVACAHCGVHVPQNDSLIAAGQHYCCEQHRELGSAATAAKR